MPRIRPLVANREGDMSLLTDGMKTSEFWFSVLILVISGIMVLTSHLSAEAWIDLSKWIGGGYAVSRGISKITGERREVSVTRVE